VVESAAASKIKIRFMPDNIETTVDKGTNLLSAALQAGVHIYASCGGSGVCGTCKVKVLEGSVESVRTEKLTLDEYEGGIRQACRSLVLSDLIVQIPSGSRLDKAVQSTERKKASGVTATGWKFDPPIKKIYLELPPATPQDNANDLFRLMWGLDQFHNLHDIPTDFYVIRKLSNALRQKDWKVTVTVSEVSDRPFTGRKNPKIINIEPGDTRSQLYALAIDVGTTTVCAQILDLNRGHILGDTIVFNQQIGCGADVISRITYSQKPGGLKKLQDLVVNSINEVIENLLKSSRIDRQAISHISVAGNTTMQQLVLGLDPKYIRLSPYVPVAGFLPMVKACTLGINVPEYVYLYVFPSISSYVGGDIISGVVAAGIQQRQKLTFYMDIGTNGEIVIGNSEWLVSTSCSAGPAFEGGGVKHGMVAMSGAIQDFSIDPVSLEPSINTINGARPKGICGSGLINITADLLNAGVIGQNGKFNSNLSSRRIRKGDDGLEYVLAWADQTETGQDIVITEVDIDNLIRAKAAMYAGCNTLSKSVNVSCSDFEQVIIAGNFGNSLNIEKAITIGLLPDISRDRFIFVGNGSLSGARLISFSNDMLDDSRKVAQMMTNIELSDNNEFIDSYMAALFLPHTEAKAFPTVISNLEQRKKLVRK
jgi:uncharacterized 2Fe-2S/4Fe-4S cluster protein (DUF4445 family)